MVELFRLILDVAAAIVPIRTVWQWQKGLYYVMGRYWYTGGPGWYLVCPGITEVKTVSVVPEIHTTPLQTITLRDGKTLTYSASLTVSVTDPHLAYNTIGHFQETAIELAARLLSVGLGDAKIERFEPSHGKRDKLVEDLRKEIDTALAAYGLHVSALGLNNFVFGIRTIRLLQDHAVLNEKPGI